MERTSATIISYEYLLSHLFQRLFSFRPLFDRKTTHAYTHPRRGAERSGWRGAPPRHIGEHHDDRTKDHAEIPTCPFRKFHPAFDLLDEGESAHHPGDACHIACALRKVGRRSFAITLRRLLPSIYALHRR